MSGRVQGVWFRGSMQREAHAAGVGGWVRNLPDGRVEAVIEGTADQVERMLAWCRRGPGGARVDDVAVHDEPPEGVAEFEIAY